MKDKIYEAYNKSISEDKVEVQHIQNLITDTIESLQQQLKASKPNIKTLKAIGLYFNNALKGKTL